MSSVTIHHLQEGQRYCVMTQYLLFNKPVGPPSCVYCELIPESCKSPRPRLRPDRWDAVSTRTLLFLFPPPPPDQKSKQAWIVAGVVLVIPVLLTPVLFYLFMFRCGRFKKWLRSTRYSIPSHVSVHTHTHTHGTAGFDCVSCPVLGGPVPGGSRSGVRRQPRGAL